MPRCLPWLWGGKRTFRLQTQHTDCRWWASVYSCLGLATVQAPRRWQIQRWQPSTTSSPSSAVTEKRVHMKHGIRDKVKSLNFLCSRDWSWTWRSKMTGTIAEKMGVIFMRRLRTLIFFAACIRYKVRYVNSMAHPAALIVTTKTWNFTIGSP